MEAYSYAASIEKYYNIATTFALAQAEYLPDFGRYHPNHPLGHVLAGLAYDWLKIPALNWIRFTNIISALVAAVFTYCLSLQIGFSKVVSTGASALLLTAHASLLAVYSGEWHMPSLALSLAGTWQVLFYALDDSRKPLYIGALLLCAAVCYHTAALLYSVCLLLLLFYVRRDEWRRLLGVSAAALFVIITVYFVIPFIVLHFAKPSDFLRTFFMYAHLDYRRFTGFTWLLAAMQTVFHSFFFIPATMPMMNWFAIPFFLSIGVAIWNFLRSSVETPIKMLFMFMLVAWPSILAIVGTRANAIYSWIFMSPLLCLVIAYALNSLHKRLFVVAAAVPLLLMAWNFYHLVLPNHFFKRENVHLVEFPQNIPKTTPVAFVAHELVLSISEIWYTGSELDFRNQNVFYPCCGEDSYLFRLRRWMRANPDSVIISDGAPERIEQFLKSEELDHVRWRDKRVAWPASLLPATLYFIREPDFKYQKRLIVWLPKGRVLLP